MTTTQKRATGLLGLTGLGGAGLFVALLGTDPIADARGLAAIALSSPVIGGVQNHRLPTFMTWATRDELRSDVQHCVVNAGNASVALRADLSDRVHNSSQPDPPAKHGRAFYFNTDAALRHCQPVVSQSPEVQGKLKDARIPSLYSGVVTEWLSKLDSTGIKRPKRIDPFRKGSIIATAFWLLLKREATSQPKLVTRFGQGTRVVDIRIPPAVLARGTEASDQICAALLPGVTQTANPPYTLDKFFWVQLTQTDTYSDTASEASQDCGKIAILVGFHLIKKQTEHMGTPKAADWLWSTFWWDDQDTRQRLEAQPNGAGDANVWKNYVFEATYNSDVEIRNPWKVDELEKPDSNCAFCHNHAFFPVGSLSIQGKGELEPIPGKMSGDFVFTGPVRAKPTGL